MSEISGGFDEVSLRVSLHLRLEEQHQAEDDTVLIDEMGICQGKARVDVAVVNGKLHGYEIKSERDNLRRLALQSEMYNRVFDEITLVCWSRHTSEALEVIPPWWEVLQTVPTSQVPTFEPVRVGQCNPNRDVRALVEFLWRPEAMVLLGERHSLRGLRGKPRPIIWDTICELFSIDEIATAVRAHLKATAVRRGRLGLQSLYGE